MVTQLSELVLCRNVVPEGPEPVVPAADVDSGFIRSDSRLFRSPYPYHEDKEK